MQNKKKKSGVGIKKANSLVFGIISFFIRPAIYLLYRFRFDLKSSKGIKRPCLILANHQTVFDQFALTMGFNFGMNYVASDTIFRHGFLSRLMVALVRPIPFSKGSSDLSAVRNMMSVIKDGGSVAMFPSGNRSFFGDECLIVPGIGRLAKMFNVPVVLVQIRGGFNTLARWKVKPSRGKMHAAVVRVIQQEELASLDGNALDDIIKQEISFNEFEYNKAALIKFRGRHKAEHLESVLFYCPVCGSLESLKSKGNEFFCRLCGASVCINPYGFFEKISNTDKLPETILEWSRLQLEYIKSFDFSVYTDKTVFKDDNISFYAAERAKKEVLLDKGAIEFYYDRIAVCGKEFFHTDITTAIVGVRKLTIYSKDSVFAVIAPVGVNLVKYMICSYKLRKDSLKIEEDYYGY